MVQWVEECGALWQNVAPWHLGQWCSVAVGEKCGSWAARAKRHFPPCGHLQTRLHTSSPALIYFGACSEIHRDTDTDLQSEPVSKESFAVLQTQIKSTTGLVAARANAIFLACTTQGIPKCIGMRAQIHYSALKNSCDVKLLH